MNENEIERIAHATNALRPDWPVASLRTLLARPELAHKTRRDVAVALTWVACESATKTPARVLESGPWWTATNAEGGNTAMRHPTRAEACATCGRREIEHEDWWLMNHSFKPLDQATKGRSAEGIAAVREAFTEAAAVLCGHGVDRERVKCAECERPTPKPEPEETA